GLEQVAHRQRVEGDLAVGGVAQVGDGVHEDDRDLAEQQDGQHLAVDVDAQHTQDGDDGPGPERDDPPVDGDAEPLVQLRCSGHADNAVQPDLQQVVRDQSHVGRGDPGRPAEAVGDIGVEGAGVGDVARHGDVADAEQ